MLFANKNKKVGWKSRREQRRSRTGSSRPWRPKSINSRYARCRRCTVFAIAVSTKIKTVLIKTDFASTAVCRFSNGSHRENEFLHLRNRSRDGRVSSAVPTKTRCAEIDFTELNTCFSGRETSRCPIDYETNVHNYLIILCACTRNTVVGSLILAGQK